MKRLMFIQMVFLLGLTAMAQELRSYNITGTNTSATALPPIPPDMGQESGIAVVNLLRAGDEAVLGSTVISGIIEVETGGFYEERFYIDPWTTPAIAEGTEVFYRILVGVPGCLYSMDSVAVTLPTGSLNTNVLNSSFDFSESSWETHTWRWLLPLDISVVGDSVNLRWLAEEGITYQLQMRTNLTSGVWTNVGDPVIGAGLETNRQWSVLGIPAGFFQLISE